MAVKAVTVKKVEWPSFYRATGTVRPRTAATISAKVMSYIHEVKVDAGDHVKAGQLLVALDSRDLNAAYQRAKHGLDGVRRGVAGADNGIAAAKAQLELARATFRRMKDLYDKKSISDQEFDVVSAKVKMAQANYKMALSKREQLGEKIQQAEQAVKGAAVMLSYTRIKAPFAGTVTAKMVDPGDLAAPGVPLLRIEREGIYRLEAQVEESRLPMVRVGQPVSVHLGALDRTLRVRVSEIVPAVNAASRAFVVKINLPRVRKLRSGLFGRADFPLPARQAVVIPVDAVRSEGQIRLVFVIDGGRARGRMVTLGESHGGQVEVLSGLAGGEKIVYPIPPALSDGRRVEVQP